MALSADISVITKEVPGTYFIDHIIADGVTVYKGAMLAVEAASGHLIIPAAATTPPRFAGIATEAVVGNGVRTCRVQVSGVFQYALSSAAITDIGKPVYASDDGTLTLTFGADPYEVLVGPIIQYVDTDTVLVAICPHSFRSAAYA